MNLPKTIPIKTLLVATVTPFALTYILPKIPDIFGLDARLVLAGAGIVGLIIFSIKNTTIRMLIAIVIAVALFNYFTTS